MDLKNDLSTTEKKESGSRNPKRKTGNRAYTNIDPAEMSLNSIIISNLKQKLEK